jgi:hypothetical protein
MYKPGKTFNMSKPTKCLLARHSGSRRADIKASMIQAEIQSRIQVKRERNRDTNDARL